MNAPSHSPPPATRRAFRIELGSGSVRLLSVVALAGLAGWFVCKLTLPLPQGWSQLLVGFLALSSMVASIFVALSGHAFLANAPDTMIDERELAERNAAYLRAYQIAAVVVLAGLLGIEPLARWYGHTASVEVFRNFLTVLFFGHLVLPAAVLAWRDRRAED